MAASFSLTKVLDSPTPCSGHQFTCVSEAKCIPRSSRCNGVRDCNDGSDEQDCHANRTCLEAEFLCEQGGRCIPAAWRCDSFRDCIDGADESGCPGNGSCTDDEFQCKSSGQCLPIASMCNGHRECADGSDEDIEMCQRIKNCPPDEFGCAGIQGGVTCMPKERRCDGRRDCADGMMKSNCRTSRSCTERQFKCKSQLDHASPIFWTKCDGDRDARTVDEDVNICKDDAACTR
ncbi:hypothetical protein HPB50_029090 [Hyalomma asiaticum]|nr:hypothetical protein HPB50_029090 [Hyalomma asiaticum]